MAEKRQSKPVRTIEAPHCLLCENLMEGGGRWFCTIYGEWILAPADAAEDCPAFKEME